MKRILISGATGLIGRHLVSYCNSEGYSVNFLTTDKSKIISQYNNQGFYWNPAKGEIDTDCFKDVSVIINLAGAPIARRWSKAYKKEIINSRVQPIDLLKKSVEEGQFKIEQFISASAIGYYPDSDIKYYDEDYISEDTSFVVDVVRQWEAAADSFKKLDIPVAKIRIGLVLTKTGGALGKLVIPVKTFVGSSLGTGKQWQSWIHIKDVVAIFMYIMKHKLEGTFNAVAPNPVTNKVLVRQIAKVLKRPLLLPKAPTFILRLFLGEMHVLVTRGQRVSSRKIEDLGFHFNYYQLKSALEDLLKK